ncbi:MAG: macro domain-containing protein [Rhodothermales bacterium]
MPQTKHVDVGGTRIECAVGDIAHQPDMEAVVNAANAELRIGGGVAGALHRAAGPGLEKECRPLAPIRPGEAVITGAHRLPNEYVIHCLGPVYGRDKPEDELLERCYTNALDLAEDHDVASVAFPAISTGAFGYPMKAAVLIAMRVLVERAPHLSSVRHIRMVLFGDRAFDVHARVLEDIVDAEASSP